MDPASWMRVLAAALLVLAPGAQAATDVLNVDLGPLIDQAAQHRTLFAVDIPHAVSVTAQGQWTSLGPTRTWTYAVQIPSAISMSFHASQWNLPASAVLTVTGASGTSTYRAGDGHRGNLWSRPLAGDTLTLSLSVNATDVAAVRFEIASLQAGYRSLGGKVPDHPRYKRMSVGIAADTASCTENYACHVTDANAGPGDATVALLISNVAECTGTLLNNTRGDGTPYVLTARHCEDGELGGGHPEVASRVTVYWDAVTPCGSSLGAIYDSPALWQTGATTVVEQQDAWLIQLDAPPVAPDAYYAGWDATGAAFVGGYSVHHALGFDKQYVGWHGQSILQHLPGATLKVGYASDYWGVVNEVGKVGAGASGGGLFDANNRLVGNASLAQLVNGENSDGVCPAPNPPAPSASTVTADYTAFSAVWNSTADTTSTTGSTTLQSVLDPGHTGQLTTSGFGLMSVSVTTDKTYLGTDQLLTVTWSAKGGVDSCTASGGVSGDGWAGTKPASGSMQVGAGAEGDVTYTLTCTRGDRTGRGKAMVHWQFIPVFISVSGPTNPVMLGGPVALNWASSVSPCTASDGNSGDGWAGAKNQSGTQNVTATQVGTVTYTLTCGSGFRVASQHVQVVVNAPGATLTSNATKIRAGSTILLQTVANGSGGICDSTGGAAGDGWARTNIDPHDGISIVESTAGIYSYTVTCRGGGQTGSSTTTVEFTNDAPFISLSANSSQQQVYPNSASSGTPDLTWSSNVTPCYILKTPPAAVGLSDYVNMNGQFPSGTAADMETIAGHYTYELRCGPGFTLTASTTIDWVNPNPQITLTTPTPKWAANYSYGLVWSANTTPCMASGGAAGDGWAGAVTQLITSKPVMETAPGSYTFKLDCGTGVSAAHAEVTVTVPSPGVTITPSATSVYANAPVDISWDASVVPCTSNDGSGGVAWGGTNLGPSGKISNYQTQPGTYTYSITCGTGAQTVHASTQVVVRAVPPTTLVASAASVQVNVPVTLTWSSPASALCFGGGGNAGDGWDNGWGTPNSISGTLTVTSAFPGKMSYYVDCTVGNAQVDVTYTSAPTNDAPPSTPSVSLSASATTLVAGSSVTLNWSSQNASACTASGGKSGDGWVGQFTINGSMPLTESTAGDVTYGLTCTGAPPAASAQVTVSFTANSNTGGGGSGGGGSSGGGSGSSGGGGGGGALGALDLAALGALLALSWLSRQQRAFQCRAPKKRPLGVRI